MGSSSSKPVGSAARTVSRRRYPQRPTPSATQAPSTPTTEETVSRPSPDTATNNSILKEQEQASTSKSEAIDLDARDPQFASSLRQIGPVTPNPTLSNSSTFNQQQQRQQQQQQQQQQQATTANGTPTTVFPQTFQNSALLVWSVRQRLNREAEVEAESFGKESHAGKEFLDPFTIRQALVMRDRQGLSEGEVELALRLKRGVMRRLGGRGVVGVVG